MKIRQENKEDFLQIYDVVKSAFATAEHSDGNEQDLVNKLRVSNAYVKELSLVADFDGKIVGFIMFSKIKIGKRTALALAPLAVLPEFQRKNLGSLLVKEGLAKAKMLGFGFVVVLGDYNFYSRFGFEKSLKYGIKSPFDVASENFMAIKLNDAKDFSDEMVKYPKEFFE